MTTTTSDLTVSAASRAELDRHRLLWVGGGLLWTVAGLVGLGADEGSGRFTASIATWLVAQLVLLAGLAAMRSISPWGSRRAGTVGLGIAVVGRLAFVAAEALTLATGELAEAIYPIGALLTAIGMTTLGIAVARTRRGDGATRFAPLAAGVFPFFAMFPLVAAGATPDLSVALWGLLLAAVGLVQGAATAAPAARR